MEEKLKLINHPATKITLALKEIVHHQVIPSDKDDKRKLPEIGFDPSMLPNPKKIQKDVANIFMLGIGGTGVVTVNQIISTAAFIEDKKVIALDQTGLSQKGGSVVSHLKIVKNDKKKSKNLQKKDPSVENDILTLNNQAKSNESEILVLNQMIE